MSAQVGSVGQKFGQKLGAGAPSARRYDLNLHGVPTVVAQPGEAWRLQVFRQLA